MPTIPASNKTIGRLHDKTTLFHAFIYFSQEASEEYAALGINGRSGYFGSRTAAMGPLPTPMVIATFYNFSPDLVTAAMGDVWKTATAPELQNARWRGAKRVLDEHVRPVLNDDDIEEAIGICERSVAGLSWAGRPLAAGNAAVLDDLAAGTLGDDRLLRLWQLVTVIREWRGDTHIGLLVAEPLDAAECTVVSDLLMAANGVVRKSRAWSDDDWEAANARLEARGWLDNDGGVSGTGRAARAAIENRTNELCAPLWAGMNDETVNRLGDLLSPACAALVNANYFAAIGRPAPAKS